jgi:hypothetical protein
MMTVLGAATRLAGAAGPVCHVRPAMFRILTTRRGCQPAFSAMKALMTNESYLLCILQLPTGHPDCRAISSRSMQKSKEHM